MYSNYKSTNTFKALVGISSAEHVMFISSLYTGSISNMELVKWSLCILQSGYEVMAEGFTIEDVLTPLGVGLNIPSFRSS